MGLGGGGSYRKTRCPGAPLERFRKGGDVAAAAVRGATDAELDYVPAPGR